MLSGAEKMFSLHRMLIRSVYQLHQLTAWFMATGNRLKQCSLASIVLIIPLGTLLLRFELRQSLQTFWALKQCKTNFRFA